MTERYSIWAKHDKVPVWLPIVRGLAQQVAAEELLIRQDRVRRAKQACRFQVLPDGERPTR